MKLRLHEDDIGPSIRTLELYISVHLGQYDRINDLFRFGVAYEEFEAVKKEEKAREALLLVIRKKLMPDLGDYPLIAINRGIFQDMTDPRARDAYDLSQVISYTKAWHEHPEGGNTRNFFTPIFSGRYEHPRCSAEENDGHVILNLLIGPEQLTIMKQAAEAYLLFQQGEFEEAFSYFTSSTPVLLVAREMEAVTHCKIHKKYVDETMKYLKNLKKEEIRAKIREEGTCGS